MGNEKILGGSESGNVRTGSATEMMVASMAMMKEARQREPKDP